MPKRSGDRLFAKQQGAVGEWSHGVQDCEPTNSAGAKWRQAPRMRGNDRREWQIAYKAEAADKVARHAEVRGCASTVNAAVVQFGVEDLLCKLSALRFGRSYPGRPVAGCRCGHAVSPWVDVRLCFKDSGTCLTGGFHGGFFSSTGLVCGVCADHHGDHCAREGFKFKGRVAAPPQSDAP